MKYEEYGDKELRIAKKSMLTYPKTESTKVEAEKPLLQLAEIKVNLGSRVKNVGLEENYDLLEQVIIILLILHLILISISMI